MAIQEMVHVWYRGSFLFANEIPNLVRANAASYDLSCSCSLAAYLATIQNRPSFLRVVTRCKDGRAAAVDVGSLMRGREKRLRQLTLGNKWY